MRIGSQIGTWQCDDVEVAIAGMGAAGLGGIEVFTTHLEPYYDDPGRFRALLDAAGIELAGAYFNSTGFVDPEAEGAVLDDATQACRFIGAVGGGFLVVNGGISKGDPPQTFPDADFAQFATVLNRIGAVALKSGIGAVMHPHWKCTVETPEEVDRLVASGVDRDVMGLCVHASHQLLAGVDPYAIATPISATTPRTADASSAKAGSTNCV